MKKFSLLFLFAIVFSIELLAAAGKLVAVSGNVLILREGKELKATLGMELEEKDKIKTDATSKTQIRFEDKTTITLGKNSDFSIDEYINDDKVPSAKFSMGSGAFRAITGKIGKIAPDRFKIKTKTASIGIRGTQFIVAATPTETIAACTEHAIVVTSLDTGISVEVVKGQVTQVEQNKAPEPPKPFTPESLKQLMAKVDGGGEKEDKKADTKKEKKEKKEKKDNKKEEAKKDKKDEKVKKEEKKDEKVKKEDKKEEKVKKEEKKDTVKKEETKKEETKKEEVKKEDKKTEATKQESKKESTTTENKQQEDKKKEDTQETKQSTTKTEDNKVAAKEENSDGTVAKEEEKQTTTTETKSEQSSSETTQSEEKTTTEESSTQTTETNNEQTTTETTTETSSEQTTTTETVQTQSEQPVVENTPVEDTTPVVTTEEPISTEPVINETPVVDSEPTVDATPIVEPTVNIDTGSLIDNITGQVESNTKSQEESNNVVTNNAPEISTIDNFKMIENNTKTISYSVSDSDGESLSVDVDVPTGWSKSIDEEKGTITFTPEENFVGTATITITANDGKDTTTQSFEIEVLGIVTDSLTSDISEPSSASINDNSIPTLTSNTPPSSATNYNVVSSNNNQLDSLVSYGYWLDESLNVVGTYVSGELTPETYIDNDLKTVDLQSYYESKYSGGVIGTVGSDTIENGNVNINIDFSQNSFTGDMNFDAGSTHWSANIDSGRADSAGFESSDISKAADSAANITGGEVSGRFYGSQADAVGGSFSLQSSDSGTANGSFSAIKQ